MVTSETKWFKDGTASRHFRPSLHRSTRFGYLGEAASGDELEVARAPYLTMSQTARGQTGAPSPPTYRVSLRITCIAVEGVNTSRAASHATSGSTPRRPRIPSLLRMSPINERTELSRACSRDAIALRLASPCSSHSSSATINARNSVGVKPASASVDNPSAFTKRRTPSRAPSSYCGGEDHVLRRTTSL